MPGDPVESLIARWLEYLRTPEGSPERESRSAVLSEFDGLCTSAPEIAWRAILAIRERESDKEILCVLAAGPLENLLSDHGEAFIERVEQLARADPTFRKMLRIMYRMFMSEEVWRRVQAAAGRGSTGRRG